MTHVYLTCPKCGETFASLFEEVVSAECPFCTMGLKRKSPERQLKESKRETTVIKACLDYLRYHPRVVHVERRTTGFLKAGSRGVTVGSPGAADIWCLVNRPASISHVLDTIFHVEIECKRPSGGKLSRSQLAFQSLCERNGIPYYVVKSVDELVKAITQLLDS